MNQPFSVRVADAAGTALRFLPVPVLRVIYRFGYFAMQGLWSFTKPDSQGAMVVVRRGEEVLLIRHTYGRRGDWSLPGGTAASGETPLQTAQRELREETQLSGELRPLGSWGSARSGAGGEIHGFVIEVPVGTDPVIDRAEIAEFRWFATRGLPSALVESSKVILRKAV